LNIDFSGEAVAVIGHGNVALDIARVLLAPTNTLEVRAAVIYYQ